MKIRSITCFYNPKSNTGQKDLDRFESMIHKARSMFTNEGYVVQSVRLATTPFPDWLPSMEINDAIHLVKAMERGIKESGFDYGCLGPATPKNFESYSLIARMLEATENLFFSGIMAEPNQGILPAVVRACAEIIHQSARTSSNGFTNLRFAALANVPAWVPFFPAAYATGDQPAFTLAIESADLALSAYTQSSSLNEGSNKLIQMLESHSKSLGIICDQLAKTFEVNFKGFDFSLAPFPDEWTSLGKAIESLGPPRIGLLGSITASAVLASALDQGNWRRTGFNGLMLPVLEDSTLAERASSSLTIKDLLLFSTVCGVGLDTVPLPGDTTVEQIYALLLDIAALSLRLNKPLTARLMPIPGKKAGDKVQFDFAYFSSGWVLDLPAEPLQNLLARDETFNIRPRTFS